MKGTRKIFKAILAVLLGGAVISVSSWAFAQGGGISGSVYRRKSSASQAPPSLSALPINGGFRGR